jgi:hypothetical protein
VGVTFIVPSLVVGAKGLAVFAVVLDERITRRRVRLALVDAMIDKSPQGSQLIGRQCGRSGLDCP